MNSLSEQEKLPHAFVIHMLLRDTLGTLEGVFLK